jgi:SagB-type dehydrogenase family enzyme
MQQPSNRDVEVALAYHEATKHSYTSVRSGGFSLDWSNRPLPYKIYPGAGTLALPRDLSLSAISTLQCLRERSSSSAAPLDLDAVTRFLFCAGGLTKKVNIGGEDYHFRAAASAGALYPVELYLVSGDIKGLEQGLYHFMPADLKLHGLRRGDWRPYLADYVAAASVRCARAVFIMTSIFWRSTWKYRARAYRYCFWDAGMILSNLLATLNAESADAEVITFFDDRAVEQLLDVDGDREGVCCLVAIGDELSAPALEPSAQPSSVYSEPRRATELEYIPLSEKEVVYEELVKLHRASRLTVSEISELRRTKFQPKPLGCASDVISVAPCPYEDAKGLGETILRRGSTRVFAREPIQSGELATIMATAMFATRGDFARLAEIFLVVHAVEGLAPGVYHYQRERGTFELLRLGDLRGEAGYLCLEQPLGADCSALIIYMCDLERVLQIFGNRGYRNAHLEAGLLGGRAYLASYSLGRGATGLTFYDDDTTAFLQPHCAQMSPLLMVAVGQPRHRTMPDC